MLEVFRQVDAIVGRPRLLAERDDLAVALGVELDEPLAEAMPDHAVADDHDGLRSLANHDEPLPTIAVARNRTARRTQIRYRVLATTMAGVVRYCRVLR